MLHLYETKAEQIINKLGYDKLIHWVDQLNAEASPYGSALNISKVHPIQIKHHPIKRLNIILRQAATQRNELLINKILSEIQSTSFKHHVLANVLHIAAADDSCQIAKSLLKYGANVNERYGNIKSEWIYRDFIQEEYEENKGPSPLLVAVTHNNLAMTQLLIENDADVNQPSDLLREDNPNYEFNSDMTPLHYAASNGNSEIINTLIQNNAQVNAKNGFGEGPLFLAIWKGHFKAVEILLEHGANPKQQNNWGAFPKDFTSSPEIIKRLTRE